MAHKCNCIRAPGLRPLGLATASRSQAKRVTCEHDEPKRIKIGEEKVGDDRAHEGRPPPFSRYSPGRQQNLLVAPFRQFRSANLALEATRLRPCLSLGVPASARLVRLPESDYKPAQTGGWWLQSGARAPGSRLDS